MSSQTINQFLQNKFLTLEQLATHSEVSAGGILELIETQCVPPHSYEVIVSTMVNCSLNQNHMAGVEAVRYYNPSLVKWIKNAEMLSQTMSLTDAAHQIRNQFNEEYTAVFGDQTTPGCTGLDDAWRGIMDGTWGICLKDISIPYLANKQLSRLKIAKLCQFDNPNHQLNATEKTELERAIENYESAVNQFAPHIEPTSSRTREVQRAVEKYLSI